MARSRIGAAAAAIALIGVSVFAGSLAAYAAPPAPLMNQTGGWTSDPTPPIIGGTVADTTDAQTVTVIVTTSGSPSTYCTAPIAAGAPNGWQCAGAADLAIGDHIFQAFTALDSLPSDLSEGSVTTTYYVGGSQPVVIASPAPGTVTPDATPTFSGTGPSRGTVTVTGTAQPGGAPVDLCTDPDVDLDGSWSCTATPMSSGAGIPPQDYSITASAVRYGSVPDGPTAAQTLSIRVPDSPTTTYPHGEPWVTGQARPAMSGTLSNDATGIIVWIEIAPNSWTHYCEAAVGLTDTFWSCPTPLMDLHLGVNTLGTTATSESGTLSPLANLITVDRKSAPVITAPTDQGYTNDTTPTITGQADFGTTVDVYLDGEFAACPAPTVVAGTFTCTSFLLSEGTHSFLAEVDGGSPGDAIQSPMVFFTVDTIAPNDPTVTTAGNTSPLPTISGFSEEGAAVTVFIDGSPVACAEPAVGDSEGNWFCAVTTALTIGAHSVGATQVDRAGNPSGVTPGATTSITVVAPSTPPSPTVETVSQTTYDTSMLVEGSVVNPGNDPLYIVVTATSTAGSQSCQAHTNTAYWGCYLGLGVGANSITAVAYFDDGTIDDPSATSNTITITRGVLDKPAVNYSLGAASVSFSGSSVPGGDIYSEFYSVQVVQEGGGSYYQFTTISDCDTGTGEGEGGEGSFGVIEFAAGTFGCSFTNLTPGIYNAYTNQNVDGFDSPFRDDYIIIPTTPSLAATPNDDGTVTFSGAGTPGYLAYVQTTAGAPACQATVTGLSTWQCSATVESGSFRAGQLAQGWAASPGGESTWDASIQGYSAYSASVAVTVAAAPAPPPAPTPTPTPTPTPAPGPWKFTFSIGGDEFEPGDSTVLTGSGLPAGGTVNAEFHSTPVVLGNTTVTPDGSFSLPVTIPLDATAGVHHFVVTITPLVGPPSTQEQAITITVKPKGTASAPPKSDVGIADTGAPGAMGEDRSDPAAPSSLTHSLAPVQAIIANPIVVGGAALAGIVLFLLVAFPAELLNSTISENYDRFAKRLPPVKLPWWERFTTWLHRTPLAGGLAITVVAAIIFGFADPGFGFDVTSLRVVLACAIALFIVGYLASTISGTIIRRRWGLATEMELKPLGLILTVIGVVLSRLLEFSPGFLLGLILGIAVVGQTTVAQRAKATLVQAGVVFVLAVLGWVGYSILTATTTPDTFLSALAFDTLVAVTAEGLTALFIGMLPFRLLDGEALFRYKKLLWLATYIVAAFAFVLIVVPSSWGELSGSMTGWLIVLAGFAIVAVGIYLYFRFFVKDEEEESEAEKEKVDA